VKAAPESTAQATPNHEKKLGLNIKNFLPEAVTRVHSKTRIAISTTIQVLAETPHPSIFVQGRFPGSQIIAPIHLPKAQGFSGMQDCALCSQLRGQLWLGQIF